MSKWISVEENFPGGEQVLVCYLKPFFGTPTRNYTTAYFEDGEGWFFWDGDQPMSYPVTHWQPLPEDPPQ